MVMNSDGSDLHQVGHAMTDCSGASWGPNDHELVFGGGPPMTKGGTLRIVNVDGTGLRTFLRRHYANPENGTHPSWSPDGRTIVFGWSAGPVGGLVAIRPDGSHLRVLVKPRLRQGDVRIRAAQLGPSRHIAPPGVGWASVGGMTLSRYRCD
jgi:hypothetical protein